MKMVGLGLSLKDSPPGFDSGVVSDFETEDFDPDHLGDDGQDYAETEQL
jgi:DNA-directed RNA polymerase subunit alpha